MQEKNVSVKELVIERTHDPILENESAVLYPYKNKENSYVTLIAFKKDSNIFSILGRWRLQDDELCLGENSLFEIRRIPWDSETITQLHDKVVGWLKTA